MERLHKSSRLLATGKTLRWIYCKEDYPVTAFTNTWFDTGGAPGKMYVVQTNERIIQRCILMTTDPGDLILDPTCGSGTTAFTAEQWGRRWITIDTSRVALALARARLMGARYPYYILSDSREGQIKEAKLSRNVPSEASTYSDIRQGFIYQSVPHITLISISNNAEIDVIWDKYQEKMEPVRINLNRILKNNWAEWQIPREARKDWSEEAMVLHEKWWNLRIARQKAIDASIAANADYEYLYDKPYEDKKKARVAGPFTVDSLSPHRVMAVGENDELIDPLKSPKKSVEMKLILSG